MGRNREVFERDFRDGKEFLQGEKDAEEGQRYDETQWKETSVRSQTTVAETNVAR